MSKEIFKIDPSKQPGLKERIWAKATTEKPKAGIWKPVLQWAVVSGLAVLILAVGPGLWTERQSNSLSMLSSEWRSGPAFAAEASCRKSREARIATIDREYKEVYAMQWAWRAAIVKDLTIKDLRENAKHWVGSVEVANEMLDRAEEIIESGNARPLTKEEQLRNEEGTNRVRDLIGTGPMGTKLQDWPILNKIDPIDRRILPLSARYWAWRINSVGDIALDDLREHSTSWIMKKATRKSLLKQIEANLESGRVGKLTPAEARTLEAGRKEIRDLMC